MTLLLLACTDGPDEGTTLVLEDAHNYAFDGGLDIASVDVRAEFDLDIEWADLTVDLQLHEMDPATDIEMLTLLAFAEFSEQQVMDALSTNALRQEDIALFVTNETGGGTSTTLSQFTLLGNDIDVETEFKEGIAESWLLIAQSGTTPGVGSRMLKFLKPGQDAVDTSVSFENGDTVLDFTVDIASATPLSAPAGTTAIELDWSTLGTDALGLEFEAGGIDKVMVARYDLDVAGLEADFLDIEYTAAELYELDIAAGNGLDLSELPDFAGFDDNGTWVVALRCSTCTHPAPPFLGTVDVQ